MANPGLGFKGGILGFKQETTFGMAVTPDKFIEMNTDGFSVEENRIHSGAIPEIFSEVDEVSRGAVKVSGDCEFEMRYEGMEVLLKNAMGGTPASAEVASIVVGATNCKIDFSIDGWITPLVATVPSLTYKAGLTQVDVASLCKAIHDAIVAAEGTGTYTVGFSLTTKKFTITKSAGTFAIKWITGASVGFYIGSTLGYTADDTGALSYVSDSAITVVFAHTFKLADDLPAGITFEIDRDITAFTVEGGKINTLAFNIEQGAFLKTTIGIIGEDMTAAAATSPTLPTSPLVVFTDGVIQYASATRAVASASLTLNNGLKDDRRFIGSRLISEPMRSGKIEVTGTLSVEFEDTADYLLFRAGTSKIVTLTFTSTSMIKGAIPYKLIINVPVVILTGGMPKIGDAGIIKLDLPFKAYATDSNSREFNVVIQNSLTSIA